MERIIIACTPRTGSNLLQFSLATHPKAISGGEWFAFEKHRNEASAWLNKQRRPALCNLIKVFSFDQKQASFERALSSGKIIYLYREDTVTQLASWQKACETGMWRTGQEHPELASLPANAIEQIEQAKELFSGRAALTLSYEQLITNWDESIRSILRIAGWKEVPIEMSLEKQP